MGWVWNVLLFCSNEEFWGDGEGETPETCEPLERINRWISGGKLVSLVKPTYAKGVGNGMDAYLFGGGFRHFDIERFIKVVEAQDWKNRAKVQLWVKGAEEGMGEDPFTLIKLRPRRARRPDRKGEGFYSVQTQGPDQGQGFMMRSNRDLRPAAASEIMRRCG